MRWRTETVPHERQVLMHHLDAEFCRALRTAVAHGDAADRHLALVRRVDARDAPHERRLAGAIVANEAHNLAGPDRDLDPLERPQAAENLTESRDAEERRLARFVV